MRSILVRKHFVLDIGGCVNCQDVLTDEIILACGHSYHAFCYSGLCNICHVFDDVIQKAQHSESNYEPGKMSFFKSITLSLILFFRCNGRLGTKLRLTHIGE